MGMGNSGGLAGILGELVSHVAQQQGVSPQEVLQQHGVTEDDVHPDNHDHESILGHLMEVAQQNPQLLQGLMATLPALMGGGQQQGGAGGGSVLGALLGGLAGGAPQQQGGGGMLGSLLSGLMGGGQAAPAPAAVDPNSAPATSALNPQTMQLISGLLGSLNKR